MKFSFPEMDSMKTEVKEERRPKSIKKLMKEGKVDLKELKRLKKERKAAKESKLLARLEQSKGVLEAARPVPKNMVKAGEVKAGRRYTVSIAVPGSILDNAQTPELRSAPGAASSCVVCWAWCGQDGP